MTPKTIHGVDPSGFLVGFEFNRERYAARQAAMTDEEREAQRERWRAANRRRAKAPR